MRPVIFPLACSFLLFFPSCHRKNPAQKASGNSELLPVKSEVARPALVENGLRRAEESTPMGTIPSERQADLKEDIRSVDSSDENRAKLFEAIFDSQADLTKLAGEGLKSSILVPGVDQLDRFEIAGRFLVRHLKKGINFPSEFGLECLVAAQRAYADPDKLKIKDLGKGMLLEWKKGDREVVMEWACQWDSASKKLSNLQLIAYQEVTRDESAFAEASESVLAKTPGYRDQILRGADHWSQRLTRIDDMRMTGHSGIAVGDVNGDGLDDLYVCDEGGLPNRLYLQNDDGTVRDFSAASRTDWLEGSRGALLLDLDNDGDQDLVVSTVALILFAENDGSGKFELRGGHPGSPSAYSLAASDFDLDGDIDLYVCTYGGGVGTAGTSGFEAKAPIPFNDAENGGRNLLLRNNGGFAFEDVTDLVGLGAKNSRWSFAAAWEDADGDGDADLYVANDFGRNCFYRNDEGRFVEVAAEMGVEDMASGMSVAWGDFNRDARMDLYVGNMFSSAGKRAGARQLFSREIERMARGNTLFTSTGTGFADTSEKAGVTMGRWAWSSGSADLNNDGWEDIVVTNGYLTNREADDL